MTWRSAATAAVSGAGVLATWIGVLWTPATPVRDRPAPPQAAASSQSPDIERQAEHLQARVHAAADYRPAVRNPFLFAERPARRPIVTTPVEAPSAPLPPPRPAVRVSGIATDVVAGVTQRTAVLSTAGGLVIVREGESVDGYTVTRIDDQGVDVTLPDGSSVRLPFSNPDSQIANPNPQ